MAFFRSFLGVLDVGTGILLIIAATFAVSGIPGAVDRLDQEFEDLIALLLLLLVGLTAGSAAIVAGLSLVRNQVFSWLSSGKLSVLCFLIGGALIVIAGAGFLEGLSSDDISSQELVVLLLPGVALIVSAVLCRGIQPGK